MRPIGERFCPHIELGCLSERSICASSCFDLERHRSTGKFVEYQQVYAVIVGEGAKWRQSTLGLSNEVRRDKTFGDRAYLRLRRF